MALETTTTTTMENGNTWPGYGYGGFGGYGNSMDTEHHFTSLEKSIGDVKSTIGIEVGEAECAIIDRMGTYASADIKNASDIAQRQSDALNSFERDLQNRVHETRQILSSEISANSARIQDVTLASANRLGDKSDAQYADIKNQLRYMETDSIKQFAALEVAGLKNTAAILEVLSANKYDALKDEVDSIRADRYADKHSYGFALQNQELTYLKNMIGSVEQTQRFGSKTVQFGTGNTSGTAQTANQG